MYLRRLHQAQVSSEVRRLPFILQLLNFLIWVLEEDLGLEMREEERVLALIYLYHCRVLLVIASTTVHFLLLRSSALPLFCLRQVPTATWQEEEEEEEEEEERPPTLIYLYHCRVLLVIANTTVRFLLRTMAASLLSPPLQMPTVTGATWQEEEEEEEEEEERPRTLIYHCISRLLLVMASTMVPFLARGTAALASKVRLNVTV